ncbi:hypothetical protein KSF_025640 [Reticulibacter mediterranei]|uniref:Uncharacterized protein n=1 Tax=Reticulibacter mediterranei TaxID=2778369 RepID=A0A8J3IDW9_9CHLR|nr:hypothetical protein [Reticulibacter mediterranei]GHO92516.1 hypothetical protein KSF_025640 [Reticulibacter mediterranei]
MSLLHSWYARMKDDYQLALIVICSLLFGLTALFYVLLGCLPSGDEPHYLIISQTLLKYHSLDVMQDYNHRDYFQFYPLLIEPHITYNALGQVLPLHNIGAPLLWLLPFALLGRLGAVWFIVLVAVLTIITMYRLLLLMGISQKTSFRACVAYSVASPFYIYSHLTFVEPIGALACVYAVYVLWQDKISWQGLTISAVLLGILPWVHMRLALLEIPLFFLLLCKIYQQYRFRHWHYYIAYLLPLLILSLALEIYSYQVWGTLNPATNQINGNSKPFEVMPFMGMVGMFFDQEHGILLNFPIFLFLLPGILLTLKRRFVGYHLLVLVVSVPYIVAFTSFRHWSGGWCPPGRFLLALLPLYAFYLAYALERVDTMWLHTLWRITLCYGFVYCLLSLLPPHNGFNAESGVNGTLAFLQISHYRLTDILPSVYVPGKQWLLGLWICGYLMGVCLLLAVTYRPRLTRTLLHRH